MRVISDSERNAGYSDDPESLEESDDTEFWRKDTSLHRVSPSPSLLGRWSVCLWVFVGLFSLILVLLIISVSVSHVNFDRKFSYTDERTVNLSQMLQDVINQAKKLAIHGSQINVDINTMDFEQGKMQAVIDDMSESMQGLRSTVSELKCQISKIRANVSQALCCNDGWKLFSSHCYFFSIDGRSWEAARDECLRRKSELLVLKNKQERSFVISNTKPLFYWLGLSDSRTGEWEWLDHETYQMDRREWMPGQPDDWRAHGLGGGEDCAHFHHDGRYNDDHCTRKYRYVCKAPSSMV